MQTVICGQQCSEKCLIHIIHNSIDFKTCADKVVFIHSTKKGTDHSFLGLC